MKRSALGVLLAFLMTACQTQAPTKVAASASPKPASADAFELPKSVALSLPPGLNIVAQGAGNIVAQGAGNIVTNASSNAVSTDSQRKVLATDVSPFLQTLLPIYTRIYTSSTRKIDLALAALRKAGLKDGVVVTFKDDDPVPELRTVTVKYKRVGKQAVVQVCFADKFDEAKLGGVAVFKDAKHGKLLVHPPVPSVKALLLASTFDHELHKASADGLVDGSLVTGGVGPPEGSPIPVVASAERYHYEFQELDPAKNQGASFSMGIGAFRTNKEKPEFNGGYGMTANFLPDGGVAAVAGMETPGTGPTFVWFAGLPMPVAADQPHSLYAVVQDGKLKDWPRDAATAALQAIVPKDDTIPKPFPISPLATDLEADPAFALPTATP